MYKKFVKSIFQKKHFLVCFTIRLHFFVDVFLVKSDFTVFSIFSPLCTVSPAAALPTWIETSN